MLSLIGRFFFAVATLAALAFVFRGCLDEGHAEQARAWERAQAWEREARP